MIGVAFDGTGFPEATARSRGGEFMLCDYRFGYRRCCSRLRATWRCREATAPRVRVGVWPARTCMTRSVREFRRFDLPVLEHGLFCFMETHRANHRALPAIRTSSIGRLFDAVSAISRNQPGKRL